MHRACQPVGLRSGELSEPIAIGWHEPCCLFSKGRDSRSAVCFSHPARQLLLSSAAADPIQQPIRKNTWCFFQASGSGIDAAHQIQGSASFQSTTTQPITDPEHHSCSLSLSSRQPHPIIHSLILARAPVSPCVACRVFLALVIAMLLFILAWWFAGVAVVGRVVTFAGAHAQGAQWAGGRAGCGGRWGVGFRHGSCFATERASGPVGKWHVPCLCKSQATCLCKSQATCAGGTVCACARVRPTVQLAQAVQLTERLSERGKPVTCLASLVPV